MNSLENLEFLEHLKPLSKIKSNEGINFLTPGVFRGNHCPMRIASVISKDIEGLSSLVVGMEECTIHSRLFSSKPEGANGELHWLYVLDSNEVVFGCREGLLGALRKMDKEGAKAVLIIVTCVPELIGEDIEGIIYEANSELDMNITFVKLGQFKNPSYPSGSRKTMEALGKFIIPREKYIKRVNILGRNKDEEHIPMPEILLKLEENIKLCYLAPETPLSTFENSGDSVLNITVSPYMVPLARKMEKDFDIPYITLHDLYDAESIGRAYLEIGNILGIELEDHFALEKERLILLENEVGKKVKGLKTILAPRIDTPIPIAAYLSKLGMEPLIIHLEEYYSEDKKNIEKILSMGYDPLVCRMVNIEREATLLKNLSYNISFGYLPNNSDRAAIPDMLDFYGQVGYERTIKLLDRILNVLYENYELGGNRNGTMSI